MKKRTLFLIGAAAAGIYSAAAGKGPFNKIRFKQQHEHIARYVEAHYPNAVYGPVEQAGNGWAVVIRRIGFPNILLYAACDDDGNYIFTEAEAQ